MSCQVSGLLGPTEEVSSPNAMSYDETSMPVPDGATARATVTCSPGRPPDGARTRHRRQDKPVSYPSRHTPRPAAKPKMPCRRGL
jgi:hypothetical protein